MDNTELVEIQCPYCGESIEIIVDCSLEEQSYIEDCSVCCQPMTITVELDADGHPAVETSADP